ncbi:pyridoxamine 5'-phosphate oxidase family protein [Paraburkholderia phosphatilytica]|uniref:pyridoxamine 5'-phosphate oxidase family protein n=1 Tax=Paraburkholderia phosphatilytica TaxID=2282883 RepID=UPI001F0CD2F1|nr:pyridoxamine 5'-phosphate oxidase family protein [Paraburkholderia phosphatilytica]
MGSPNVRTVELRRVSASENLIAFHTDLRSPKVAELCKDPGVALVGVNRASNLQIRVFGKAHVLRDGAGRLDAWNSSPDRQLILYRTLLAPGNPIGWPEEAFGETHGIPGPGECPLKLDWLDLSETDSPRRASFARNGDMWSHSWVAP